MTATDPFLTDEQRALRDSVCAALQRHPEVDRCGFDPELWRRLREIGVPELAVPGADGGDATDGGVGAGSGDAPDPMLDSLVLADLCGRRLAAVPVVETVVATRLLHRSDERTPWWEEIRRGELIATLAPRPARDGVFGLVPAGAVAPVVIGLSGDDLVAIRSRPPVSRANTAWLPLADRAIDGSTRIVLASGPAAHRAHDHATAEWKSLVAGLLAGIAAESLAIAVGYVAQRHQFGRPIGANQVVRHRLADLAVRIDGALLLARESCRAGGNRTAERAARLATMAYAYCGATAQDATGAALHLHGGYGFTLEYPIQRYLRRAKAWALLAGDPCSGYPAIARAELADRLEPAALLADDPGLEVFRAEVRGFLAEYCTGTVTDRALESGTVHDWGLHRALADRGWLFSEPGADHGCPGRAGPLRDLVLREEATRAGAPMDGVSTTEYVVGALREVGSEQQRREVLPALLGGSRIAALGFSEPEAGSDVAAARTTARRDGDSWVINGQKMFTTLAHQARWIFLLARTDPDAAKHRGLTMFLVPVPSAGLEMQPVHTLGGERTNVTFYTDVRVPDSARVGETGGGWSVLGIALGLEHSLSFSGECLGVVDAALAEVRRDGLTEDPRVLDRIGRAVVDTEVGRLLAYRCAWLAERGATPGPEGSMAKLFSTEALVRHIRELTDAWGPRGLLDRSEPGAPAGGHLEHMYRHSQVTTIYGGTSEIHREIIADHHLGLAGSRNRKSGA